MSDIIKKWANTSVVGDEHAIEQAEDNDLYTILHLIREQIVLRDQKVIIEVLKPRLAQHAEVVKVIFGCTEWDNGWFFEMHEVAFLDEEGNALEIDPDVIADGNVAYKGNDDLAQALTELSSDYGPLTGGSELVIDLPTGDVTCE